MIKNFKKWLRKRKPKRDPWAEDQPSKKRSRKSKKKLNTDLSLSQIIAHSVWFRRGLIVLGIFLAAEVTTQIIALYIKPMYVPQSARTIRKSRKPRVSENFNNIRNRNIFDFQGRIPPIFDPGDYGCFSEARPSNKRVKLLGTIVMEKADLSVAILDDGSGAPVAVKKGMSFGRGQFVAMEVQRKRICFQIGQSKVFEYVEIRDGSRGLRVAPQLSRGGRGTRGITITGENQVEVSKSFLEDKLKNLNEILQTARAVPNMEGGKFSGFLIQSIQQDSLFYELGIRQGDVLTGVNDIVLDNAGKGLEAFQALRNADQIALQVIRNGQKTTMNFSVR